MKATIELPDALYREAKIRAAREGVKIKDLISKGIVMVLNESPKVASAQKKSGFPLFHGPGGPLLQQKELRSLSFLDDDDDLERYQRALRR